MKPKLLKISKENELVIKWEDNVESRIPLAKLRRLCPCATCITENLHESKTYIPLFLESQTKVVDLALVGNYALQIKWKDGHNTGIYEYPYLIKIARA